MSSPPLSLLSPSPWSPSSPSRRPKTKNVRHGSHQSPAAPTPPPPRTDDGDGEVDEMEDIGDMFPFVLFRLCDQIAYILLLVVTQPCFRALYSYIMLLKGWLLQSCPLYAIKGQICHKKPSFCLKFEHFIKKIGENLRFAQLKYNMTIFSPLYDTRPSR